MTVELEHLHYYDDELLDLLLKEPKIYLSLFQNAAKEVLLQSIPRSDESNLDQSIPEIQVILQSRQVPTSLRNITATEVNRLLMVPGIIISASKSTPKATSVVLLCKNCRSYMTVHAKGPLEDIKTPSSCSQCEGNF